MPKDFLLEIGVEELPARFITLALEQLKAEAEKRLREAGLSFQKVSVFGTPRRLAVLAAALPEKSPDRSETALGPRALDARDEAGQWTTAAIGFAKSLSVGPEQLKTFPSPRGERLGLEKTVKGEPTNPLLARLCPQIISSLRFPKTMTWEESGFSFARPIRWILALYGTRLIRFSLAGIASGQNTYGHLEINPPKIKVPNPQRYAPLLKNRLVIADPEERRKTLRRILEEAARHVKGHILPSPELFDEVANLVEHPVAVTGSFDAKYLDLPASFLSEVMQKHQKFFPVLKPRSNPSQDPELLNHFVAIRNGASEHQQTVREGYERVLAARLADAQFFYNKDRKKRLGEFAAGLSGVGFHEKLGTMADKVKRVEYLAKEISAQLQLNTDIQEKAVRAAQICKADLLTQIVYELPELQGIAGRIYAEKNNEPKEIAEAIEQHYWPLTTDGPIPQNAVGCVLSLADKIDTLCGDFSVGIIPTGSTDPHGLRKAGTGVIRILLENKWGIGLNQIVQESCSLIRQNDQNLQKQVLDFLKGRLENWLLSHQYRQDEVAAVLAVDFNDMPDCAARLEALKAIRAEKMDFMALSMAFKRTANILKQAQDKGIWNNGANVNHDLLQENAEKELRKTFINLQPQIETNLKEKAYKSALESMVLLKPYIDTFFEKTMVMTDDPALRTNRLAILNDIFSLFSRIADFRQLQETPLLPSPPAE
jgi:glycyl-tRNA synthetase beta chain